MIPSACARTCVRRFPRLLASAGLLAGLVFVAPRSAAASIMIALDLPDLVLQADHIAVVEVGSVHAAWDDRHERIYSTIDLKVIERWKTPPAGPSGSSLQSTPVVQSDRLTVVQAGGTVGDISMTVMGMGTFIPGERSLVFLRGPMARAQVIGMTQGKRTLRYESTSRNWLVAPPDLRQAKLVRPPTLPGSAVTSAPGATSSRVTPPPPNSQAPRLQSPRLTGAREMPLDDLRVEVRRLLGTGLP